MFHVVLVSLVILAVIFCCSVPLPVLASVAASGLLWWLFVAYRNSLGAMSGATSSLEFSSGILEFASISPKSGVRRVDKSTGRAGLGGRGFDDSSGRISSPEKFSSSTQRNVVESPRNSSRSGLFDEPFSPISSPSVSVLSRSSYRENRSYRSDDVTVGSPMLPPGSYPWLMPSSASGVKKRINLESVPVKIKVSKPTASFLPTVEVSEEPKKMDSSKQIIQALKAMSRKRLHTSESDDSREESFGMVPKRRPMDFHHNLYASHLGSSDSSLQLTSENQEDSTVDQRVANGSEPQINTSPNGSMNSLPNNGVVNNQPISNKRPRPANDGGNQAAKKRNHNNEILSSLSSSLGLLDPSIYQRSSMKRRECISNKEPPKRTKTLETHCVEVQTLPSPISKEEATKTKEDKGTGTDRIADEGTSTRSTQSSSIIEKKVTDKMAATLLKSALMKFANSGELITPDTSLNSTSILCESPKTDETDKSDAKKSVRFTMPEETPKAAEPAVQEPAVSAPVSAAEPSKVSGVSFGSPAQTSSTPVVASSSKVAAEAPSFPKVSSGFTLGSPNAMAITPSPTENANLFSFGSNNASKSAASTEQKPSEPVVSAPSALPTFGSQGGLPKAGFTFGAQSPTTTAEASVPKEAAAVVTSSAENKVSPFTFGQTVTSQSGGFKLGGSTTVTAVTTSSAPASTKPGGFAFTPSAKFTFGSTTSTTATTTTPASVVTPSVQTSIAPAASSAPATTTQSTVSPFTFGNSTFGAAKPAETTSKGLFGMPPPPSPSSKPAAAAEPPKLFGASSGGFNFSASTKDATPAFPASTTTTTKPEEKKDGFTFGGFGQKTEPARPFSFGSSAGATQAKPTAPAFSFGASSGAQPAFGSFSSKPADPNPPAFNPNPPATTSSSLFGSNTSTASTAGGNSVVFFGSKSGTTAAPFGTSSTPPTFGSGSLTTTTTANPTPAFGSNLSSLGSTAPSFGAAAPAFGSSATTFGSGAAGFGSTNPPTFGAVAGAPSATTTSAPAPTFGSGASSTPQFGSSSFGSSASVPAFGSSFGAAPAFGAPQTTTQQSTPTFGASQTTTPAFGAPQTTTQTAPPTFGAQSNQTAPLTFGAPQATSQPTPAFGASQTPSQSPFSFTGGSQPASSSGFNFQAPATSGAPKPMFQFGASGTPAQPSAPQPFAFSGAPTPAPMGAGFGNTMFSIGSGSAAPRTRTTLRARKK